MHPSNPSSPVARNVDSSSSLARPSLGVIGSHLRTHSPITHPLSLSQNFPPGQQSSHQPWLSSQHARPPMPSLRPQTPQTLQPRSLIPQQPMPPTSQPVSFHSQDNSVQPLSSSRNPQEQISGVQASGNQRPPSLLPVMGQASINIPTADALESCTRILSKRNIQELVNQVDPLEKLDPEVEDVLVDIADDFIDSVTAFGCSLAKHRKSDTLEAKDILLHLDRTWNMTLPGFSGDEIKTCKKPVGNDIHKERLAVIKKSLIVAEVNKSSAGQASGNIKGHLAKPAHNAIGS